MSHQLHVHLLPSLIEADALNGGTAVIIDILRASSTMITTLHNGANRVIPCGTVDEAFRLREQSPNESIMLGGERGGVRIQGFDFGNSPAEYSTAAVAGRTVVFTTTNGTKAILKASPSATILIGAFLNRAAVIRRLNKERRNTHLICAGTDGVVTGEDVLFAGAIIDGLMTNEMTGISLDGLANWNINDSAMMARALWRRSVADSVESGGVTANASSRFCEQLTLAMRDTQGGRNLLSLGYDSDLILCSQMDQYDIVPELDRQKSCLFC